MPSGDRRGQIPMYSQVAAALRRRIEVGDWLPGDQISTLQELEEEFQVARVTVRQAVELLEQEGLVVRKQGRGTYVSERVNDKRWLKLETTWEALVSGIRDNVPQFIKVDNPPPFPKLREDEGEDGLVLADEYVYLRSVQNKDGEPYGVVNLHLARHIFEKKKSAFLKQTALPVLATLEDVHIKHAHQTVVIGTADRETADLLDVSLSAPTAECRCVVADANDVAIYVAEITYRSDCIKLFIDLLDRAKPATRTARRSRKRAA
jgi:GntR family transcriptional regulator